MPRILDLDLDLFLDHRKASAPTTARLSDDEYRPWRPDQVRHFLESQCGLDRAHPIPGRVFTEHDELFYHLRTEVDRGTLTAGLDFVHADAHADLGIGNSAFYFITTDWLGRELGERVNPPREGYHQITNSSWLLYAAACQWIKKLTYVYHPEVDRSYMDLPIGLVPDEEVEDMIIRLKQVGPNYIIRYQDAVALSIEPEIPFRAVAVRDYRTDARFDRVFLTQSPGYTPPAADALLEVIRAYIDESS